jgi:hypothetical protein
MEEECSSTANPEQMMGRCSSAVNPANVIVHNDTLNSNVASSSRVEKQDNMEILVP